MKKNKEWLKKEVKNITKLISEAWGASIISGNPHIEIKNSAELQVAKRISDLINQLDEPEVLSTDWIKNNQRMWASAHGVEYYISANKLYGKIVPKQEEVDRAYKDGYEEGRQHGFYKGYREGLGYKGGESEVFSEEWINEKAVEVYADTADAEVHAVFRMSDLQNLLVPTLSEKETVADVIADFFKSLERLKEVMSMEVKELEE